MACGCKWQSRKYRGISIILVFAVSTAFGAYGWTCKLKLPTWVFHAWLIKKKVQMVSSQFGQKIYVAVCCKN